MSEKKGYRREKRSYQETVVMCKPPCQYQLQLHPHANVISF